MLNFLKQNLILLLTILTALTTIISAVVYRFYSLNTTGLIISIILIIITFIILQLKLYHNHKLKSRDYNFKNITIKKPISNKLALFLLVLFLLVFFICLYLLFNAQTSASIISPWEVVPNYFWLFFTLCTGILIYYILKINRFFLVLISLYYFLCFAVALIVYKIGYGFDPFIHQATVDLISKTGEVMPKPFYYLGQYGLITILHKIFFLPVITLDKLLAPVTAALTLPYFTYQFLKKYFTNKKINNLLIISLLILPFSIFILTTPQNLAFLFLIITILFGLRCSSNLDLLLVYLFSLASLAIHPIAGIPALLFSAALTVYHADNKKLKKYLLILIFILTSLALPLSFYILSYNAESNPAQNTGEVITSPIQSHAPNQENFILNSLYLYGFNIKTLLILLMIAGILIANKYRQTTKIYFLNLILSLAFLISYYLTSKLDFNFLIAYERSNYTDRILTIIIIFLIPFIITAIYSLLDKILKQNIFIKTTFLIFLTLLITTSFYFSYPRFDRYHNSRGYSVSQNDITAVNWIEDNAQSDYIVLANQQVSAAALRELGFSKYITPSLLNKERGLGGEVFIYPIPTSGPLYQFYLDMVYDKPSKATIQEAMDFTGVEEAYFVLNKYWWAFPNILAEAKLEADLFYEIDNGEVYIFKYIK